MLARGADPTDARVSLRVEILKPRNYIDFARAALGSAVLLGMWPEVASAAVEADFVEADPLVWAVQVSVLFVGALVQTLRYEHRASLYAPLFYLSGLTLGMCGLYPALFAMVLVWSIHRVLPGPGAMLSIQTLLVLIFGVVFRGVGSRETFVAAALVFLPVALSLLSRRRLGLFNKRVKV